MGYICFVLALIMLTLNVPRSHALNKDGTYNRRVLRTTFSLFALLIISFFNVQASDPGYLEEGMCNFGRLGSYIPVVYSLRRMRICDRFCYWAMCGMML